LVFVSLAFTFAFCFLTSACKVAICFATCFLTAANRFFAATATTAALLANDFALLRAAANKASCVLISLADFATRF